MALVVRDEVVGYHSARRVAVKPDSSTCVVVDVVVPHQRKVDRLYAPCQGVIARTVVVALDPAHPQSFPNSCYAGGAVVVNAGAGHVEVLQMLYVAVNPCRTLVRP